MPTLEIPPRNFDELVEKLSTTPFPADAKIRVTITGLAFCSLDKTESHIYFLTHVDNHVLKMAVIKRVRRSGAVYPADIYEVEKGDPISIKMDSSQEPGSISSGQGNYPLAEMVHLHKQHGDKPIKYIGPTDELHPHFPTGVSIKHASFYTMALHPRLFVFREQGLPTATPPKGIGYIMGGVIGLPTSGDGNATITCKKESFNPPTIPLPGQETEEVVYDIIFDNHCVPDEIPTCNKQVEAHGGKKGTDFFYYYDMLREDGNFYHQFCLEHLLTPTIAGGEAPDTNGGGEGSNTETENPDLPGGSGEVAACNPILIDPPPF